MVASRPLFTSRPHRDLKTIAGHVDANENLSRHESSALADCLPSPNLAGCGLAVRPRQLFGLSAGTDWDDHASRRTQWAKGANDLSQSLTLSSARAEDTTKIQGVRSELASAATTGGGGPQAPPTRICVRPTRI